MPSPESALLVMCVRPQPPRRSRPIWPRVCLPTAALAFGLTLSSASLASEPLPAPYVRDATAMSETNSVVAWIRDTADNRGLPFLIVDKLNAEVKAFDPQGRLLGSAPVLLGLTRGDVSPAGIGDRPLSAIGPEDRITPAGRFLASMGENLGGKGILWIDYDAALSLHPVVTGRISDLRLQRLATATVEDNRISYGCVNVPVKFYDEIVQPAFSGTTGIVYILPEVLPLAAVFSLSPEGVAPASIAGLPLV